MIEEQGTPGGGLRRRPVLGWLRLLRVAQRVEKDVAWRLGRWGLSNAQFDVLARVGAEGGISQQALADSLLVTKGNVAQLLARMEGRGLISRRPEGRTNRLFLTDEGRELFEQVVPEREDLIAEKLSALSEEEQRLLHELLRKLDRSLEGGPASGTVPEPGSAIRR